MAMRGEAHEDTFGRQGEAKQCPTEPTEPTAAKSTVRKPTAPRPTEDTGRTAPGPHRPTDTKRERGVGRRSGGHIITGDGPRCEDQYLPLAGASLTGWR